MVLHTNASNRILYVFVCGAWSPMTRPCFCIRQGTYCVECVPMDLVVLVLSPNLDLAAGPALV